MAPSKEQLDEMKEAFTLYDIDRDGLIPTSHVGSVLRSLGINVSDAELTKLSNELGDAIDGKKFMNFATSKLNETESEEEFVKAFTVFDKDNSGYIETAKFAEYMMTLGEKLPEHEVQMMVQEADPTNSGTFNYHEFVQRIMAK
ncbi:myosin I light chain Cam2 [Schizosaccharomyces cryophilus OY26]|uniref:Myosin I light chain Cam2 n=1 Tax=Schizosaccharomyces cryophilus (strain OY26 / ATCC MYA-4695 / CBS 11777 / NBRC 106824 / NRRL Y48691) TaxID=653667 RepID=S9WZS7_SCHCR|nr:myosin I light chain Cam2 [Schizosaccharomyces cryophilus OY26]EPY50227.1 myosin I light chain Cam2 [Schizosaccharomyces cryophilus OY26]